MPEISQLIISKNFDSLANLQGGAVGEVDDTEFFDRICSGFPRQGSEYDIGRRYHPQRREDELYHVGGYHRYVAVWSTACFAVGVCVEAAHRICVFYFVHGRVRTVRNFSYDFSEKNMGEASILSKGKMDGKRAIDKTFVALF